MQGTRKSKFLLKSEKNKNVLNLTFRYYLLIFSREVLDVLKSTTGGVSVQNGAYGKV